MYGFEWSVPYLWHRMGLLQRLDFIMLALLLVHVVVVVTRVSYRCKLARRAKVVDALSTAFQRDRRKLVAELNSMVSTLHSINFVAPYLGLAGTSVGIICGLRDVALSAESGLAAVIYSGVVPVAFVTSVAGLFVALPAAWSYNYLLGRIELLQSEVFDGVPVWKSRHFRFAQKFPLAVRFSKIPFFLIAAPVLAILAGVVFMEYSSYKTSTGLYVDIASSGLDCEYEDGRLVVLRVTSAGEVFLNQEQQEWNGLASHLSDIYRLRLHRTLYLIADEGAAFQQVVHAIDIAKNAPVVGTSSPLDITVQLITSGAMQNRCPQPTVTRHGLSPKIAALLKR